jgi:hypothetical protein
MKIRECYDCGRKVNGLKKIIGIKDHYPSNYENYDKWIRSFLSYNPGMAERYNNLKDRLGKLLCHSCRNFIADWCQGRPTATLILEGGVIHFFRSKLEREYWPEEKSTKEQVIN